MSADSISVCVTVNDSFFCVGRLIKPEYEVLLQELCEEQIFMHIKPGDVKQRKKQRKVETELADLRGKLSSNTNKTNIVLSNREIRLLRCVPSYVVHLCDSNFLLHEVVHLQIQTNRN
jgi:exonuclease 3'-5' domain-containing protein 1